MMRGIAALPRGTEGLWATDAVSKKSVPLWQMEGSSESGDCRTRPCPRRSICERFFSSGSLVETSGSRPPDQFNESSLLIKAPFPVLKIFCVAASPRRTREGACTPRKSKTAAEIALRRGSPFVGTGIPFEGELLVSYTIIILVAAVSMLTATLTSEPVLIGK